MSIEFSCPCCGSNSITYMPAYLSQFVIWRTTGIKPNANKPISLAKCDSCNYYFSSVRFTDAEMQNLYQGYRDENYNKMRSECEPTYTPSLYSEDYINNRKQFINNLINKNVSGINSILDYGGDDGRYIPDVKEKYVYDLSGTTPINGIIQFDINDSKKFDLVMNCQVLEHVSDINNLITNIKNYSTKYLYIEVPAYRRPPPINMIVGEHINFFRKSSLHALLNKHAITILDNQVNYDLQVLAVLGKI
jgi:hypothetical protein